MKTRFTFLMTITLALLMTTGCEKPVEDAAAVTLGAQENTTLPGFYSVSKKKTYTMSQAADSQNDIDLLCFFEEYKDNNVCLASPGSGIKEIFTGDDMPDNWEVKNLTTFCQTSFTAEQFKSVQNGDQLIETSFDPENNNKKAKDVKAGDVWAIRTEGGIYGLIHITAVTQGEDGSVTFEIKTREVMPS